VPNGVWHARSDASSSKMLFSRASARCEAGLRAAPAAARDTIANAPESLSGGAFAFARVFSHEFEVPGDAPDRDGAPESELGHLSLNRGVHEERCLTESGADPDRAHRQLAGVADVAQPAPVNLRFTDERKHRLGRAFDQDRSISPGPVGAFAVPWHGSKPAFRPVMFVNGLVRRRLRVGLG
jgi:hypothetical protein